MSGNKPHYCIGARTVVSQGNCMEWAKITDENTRETRNMIEKIRNSGRNVVGIESTVIGEGTFNLGSHQVTNHGAIQTVVYYEEIENKPHSDIHFTYRIGVTCTAALIDRARIGEGMDAYAKKVQDRLYQVRNAGYTILGITGTRLGSEGHSLFYGEGFGPDGLANHYEMYSVIYYEEAEHAKKCNKCEALNPTDAKYCVMCGNLFS